MTQASDKEEICEKLRKPKEPTAKKGNSMENPKQDNTMRREKKKRWGSDCLLVTEMPRFQLGPDPLVSTVI